jgi:hypothetical protein
MKWHVTRKSGAVTALAPALAHLLDRSSQACPRNDSPLYDPHSILERKEVIIRTCAVSAAKCA